MYDLGKRPMNNSKNHNLAEELKDFLIKISQTKDTKSLREQAYRLIDSITPHDFESAERKLQKSGISKQKIQQLSSAFIMMGLLEREKWDLRSQLPDYHILRKVMAEHEMIRCFLADLDDVALKIQQAVHLTPTINEFMRLSHIVEHLNSLEEHICREDDVLFPALREQGWESLFLQIENEHRYIQMAVNDLVKLTMAYDKIPFNSFKNRLLSTIRYLCPLLREHLFHEDRVVFPLAVSNIGDSAMWDRLRNICNEIDYCGIHL